MIGGRRAAELTRDPLQECLNQMAARGDSFSAVKKARTYIAAALEYALDERLIGTNPARKLELPGNRLRKPCGRFWKKVAGCCPPRLTNLSGSTLSFASSSSAD